MVKKPSFFLMPIKSTATLSSNVNTRIRSLSITNQQNLKPLFYGIEFFYDEASKTHKCELKMNTIVYKGFSKQRGTKEEAYVQARNKYLLDFKRNLGKPERDILTEKRESKRRNSGIFVQGRAKMVWKKDGGGHKYKARLDDVPDMLSETKFETLNFGTAEKPIVYRRGKPSIKKYPNHKKRKLKDDEKAKVVNKSQKKVVHNSDPDWEDF